MAQAGLIQLFRIARYKTNLKSDGDGVHPEISPADSFGRPESDEHALDVFLESLEVLEFSDYGDFMRCVNLYLCRLKECLRHRTPDILEKIEEIRRRVQYSPDWCIESTRPWLLSKALELRDYVRSHHHVIHRKRESVIEFLKRVALEREEMLRRENEEKRTPAETPPRKPRRRHVPLFTPRPT